MEEIGRIGCEKLWKLYEQNLDEERYYLTKHYMYLNLYIGLLSALVTAMGVGFLSAREWYHFLLLCVVPVLVIKISDVGKENAFRAYQRFMETISVRAKLESDLGLLEPRAISGNDGKVQQNWWESEPLVDTRYLASRARYSSSRDFVTGESRKGAQRLAERLLSVFKYVAVASLVLLLATSFCKLTWTLASFARVL